MAKENNKPPLTPPNPGPNPAQVAGTETQPGAPQVTFSLSKNDLMELVREMKKPDEVTQAKMDKDKAKELKRRERRIRIARAEEAAKKAREKACRHRKPNGEETRGGQEFSDGRVRLICTRCQKTLHEYWAPSIAQGMAIAERMRELGLTEADVAKAQEYKGTRESVEGIIDDIATDDFALGMPRGGFEPDLTTDHH